MSERPTEERVEREIQRFLRWQASDLAGAPTEVEMVRRIEVRRRAERRGRRGRLVAVGLALAATTAVGYVLTGTGSEPSPETIARPSLSATPTGSSATPTATARTTAATSSPAASSAPTSSPLASVRPTTAVAAWTPRPLPAPAFFDMSAKRSIPGFVGARTGTVAGVARAADGGVWLAVEGRPELVHVDSALRATRRDIAGGAWPRDLASAPGALWVLTAAPGAASAHLHRLDPSGAPVDSFPVDRRASRLLEVSDEGVWLKQGSEAVLIDGVTGRERGGVPLPASGPAAIAFGSLWAWTWDERPEVTRADLKTGAVVARIPLTQCEVGHAPSGHVGAFHRGRIHAIRGATGAVEAIVASCPDDDSGARFGPDAVIDPERNTVLTEIDLGMAHGDGIALDGRWWVAAHQRLRESPDGLFMADPASGGAIRQLRFSGHWLDQRIVASGDALWVMASPCDDPGRECASDEGGPFLVRLSADELERATTAEPSR